MALDLGPVPNFNVNIPQADPLGAATKALQLRQLSGQVAMQPLLQQEQQQRLQQEQLANQSAQIELDAKKAYNAYWANPDKYQSDDLPRKAQFAAMLGISADDPLMSTIGGMLKAGVPADHALAEAKSTLQVRQEWSKATQEQQAVLKNAFEQLREIAAPILAEHDATKKQALIEAAQPGLAAWAKFDPTLAQVIPQLHAGNFDAFANRIGAEEKALDFTKKTADASAAQQKVIPPGETMSPEMKGEAAKSVSVETNPDVINAKVKVAGAEAVARQQAAQGNPEDAGKLLASGDLTLADLKSRGTTPKFITQAVAAAQKLDPKYNPADEVIAEHVAKSPALNTFFGSANSLIAKGGTLDQLEALGKKIPQHDWPILNTVDDWQKLARGQGPLAAYAATALGVADDYSKVMGGGQGSDTSRDQALKLFAKAASPEQRHDAVQATRAAVNSQRSERIGKNKFLQRMYDVEQGGTKTVKMRAPNGQEKDVPEDQVDHYKKLGAAVVTQ